MIDARGLHGWLGVKNRFNDWIRERLEQYAFEAGKDFYGVSRKTGGRPTTDYYLTVGMAKELAMLERSNIGSQTRRYFIEMEQVALEEIGATIASYSFVEVTDFVRIIAQTGGRPRTDYLLTVNMAKELAMI